MSVANPDFKPDAALGFDHLKSLQMIAYFVRKAGGSAEKLKLVKLVYLAERLSFQKRGRPMNFDSYFSLPHGPVASSALDGMDRKLDDPAWEGLHLAANRRDISIDAEVTEDRLSRSDRAILDETWQEFGAMGAWEIRDWTHKHCPEYTDVGAGNSLPIPLSDIMSEVGQKDPDNAARDVRILQKEVGRLERLRAA